MEFVIAWLCGVRHFIHTHIESCFFSENIDGEQITRHIFGYDNDDINTRLHNVNLPVIDWKYDIIDIPDDSTYKDDGFDDYDDAMCDCVNKISELHEQIEKYLRNIDKQHNTHYAPTGATRIY